MLKLHLDCESLFMFKKKKEGKKIEKKNEK